MQTSSALTRSLADEIAVGRLAPGAPLPAIRTLARRLGCAPGTVARSYAALRSAGIVEGTERSSLRVAAAGAARAYGSRDGGRFLRLAGSDDPALDLLLLAVGPAVALVPGRRGSVHGLGELARGAADAATLHLSRAADGSHNDAFLRGLLGAEPITVVHLWRREQVLVLPPGNPAGITGVRDLAGRRLAWRDAGTGSRLLTERLLTEAGVVAEPDRGVRAPSHRGVAIAVATGAAEAGVAARAAAGYAGLDWLPLIIEPFELAVRDAALPAVQPLLATLARPDIRDRIEALGGYDLSATGVRRTVS